MSNEPISREEFDELEERVGKIQVFTEMAIAWLARGSTAVTSVTVSTALMLLGSCQT